MTEPDHLAAGRAALAAGRWEEARAAFAAALAEAETPQALDGMAVALWWLGETRASVAHAERAYAGFRRASEPVPAAATASFLCQTWASNFDNPAVARGWLARAERVAGEVDPNPLRGWLWLLRGYLEPDPGRAPASCTGASSSGWGPAATPTRPTPCSAAWAPRAGPVPSGPGP
jgi:tetratricopeptide (TPR) repeat protein